MVARAAEAEAGRHAGREICGMAQAAQLGVAAGRLRQRAPKRPSAERLKAQQRRGIDRSTDGAHRNSAAAAWIAADFFVIGDVHSTPIRSCILDAISRAHS
jgi:hypothetical protein